MTDPNPDQAQFFEHYKGITKSARSMSKPSLLGNKAAYALLDECHHLIFGKDLELDRDLIKPRSRFHGWKQPIPSTQEHHSSAPSAAKRAMLRANRKKRK